MNSLPPFHLAFPVHDLAAARHFYINVLECSEGRSADTWIDFNFYGHQIVAHYRPMNGGKLSQHIHQNKVDGHDVPVPHFGIVLPWAQWHQLAERLQQAGMEFIIEPYIRFRGQAGEQATMFLFDPSGNALELKAFQDPTQLFAK